MAISTVAIANSAAYHLGAEPILSFDDGTKFADYCKNSYDVDRQAVLRVHPWNFAKKRVVLSPSTTTPPFKYSYQFVMPTDCLRILTGEGSFYKFDDYEIEDRKILCDLTTLQLIYIRNETDPTKFDSVFTEVLALYMAWKSCYHLTKSRTLKADLWEQYQFKLSNAKTINAQEISPRNLEADEWIDSHQGAYRPIPNVDY